MTRTRKQPLDFRVEEVSYVMQRWLANDSCSLVGVGSVGKTNLLQHLADPDVQAHYMEITDTALFKAMVIDPNLLVPISDEDNIAVRCWSGYELLMHRLYMAFHPFELLGEDARHFSNAYAALQDGTNPLYASMGLRYLEIGLEFFMQRGVSIVFMFDEFEEMLRQMPVKFFLTLRGLRDVNKKQLKFLTFTRTPLNELVDQMGISRIDIEPFIELFHDNVLYVGPYNETDAYRMVENLMRRRRRQYSADVVNFVVEASGGYAGLLRSIFHSLESLEGRNLVVDDDTLSHLLHKRAIREECETLWGSLLPNEKQVLKMVAGLMQYESTVATERAVNMLIPKRLLRLDKAQGRLYIQPPIFAAFVRTNPD